MILWGLISLRMKLLCLQICSIEIIHQFVLTLVMNFFKEKLMRYDKDCELASLLHIQTEIKKPPYPLCYFDRRDYVSEMLRDYGVDMHPYPDLSSKDQDMAFFIYSRCKHRLNIFTIEEVKRRPIKKKNRKSTQSREGLSTCACCDAKYQIKHKCNHTLCDQKCVRLKKSASWKKIREAKLQLKRQKSSEFKEESEEKLLNQDDQSESDEHKLSQDFAESGDLSNFTKKKEVHEEEPDSQQISHSRKRSSRLKQSSHQRMSGEEQSKSEQPEHPNPTEVVQADCSECKGSLHQEIISRNSVAKKIPKSMTLEQNKNEFESSSRNNNTKKKRKVFRRGEEPQGRSKNLWNKKSISNFQASEFLSKSEIKEVKKCLLDYCTLDALIGDVEFNYSLLEEQLRHDALMQQRQSPLTQPKKCDCAVEAMQSLGMTEQKQQIPGKEIEQIPQGMNCSQQKEEEMQQQM